MTTAVTRGADALVRAQAARLDGFATRLDDLEPDDQLAAHDDALAVLTAALTDPGDPDALGRLFRRHLGFNVVGVDVGPDGRDRPSGWKCTCGHELGRIDVVSAYSGHVADAVRAEVLGGES
ncbi:hypothetical protein ACFWH7_04565 [Cellulosimicrobium cellulans]|uniref:hypothetical protein n=1 Tax=Cellulosimicrobium cellulans TaxID=1710 RepID=UPI00365EC40A